MRRRPPTPLRLALVLLLPLTGALALAMPAAANPLEPPGVDIGVGPAPVIGEGYAAFYLHPSTAQIEVRLVGKIEPSTRVVGSWRATITGHRQATATSIPTPVLQTWSDPAYAVSARLFFPYTGDYGSLTVDFAYRGVGDYVLTQSVHVMEWNPFLGPNTVGYDLG